MLKSLNIIQRLREKRWADEKRDDHIRLAAIAKKAAVHRYWNRTGATKVEWKTPTQPNPKTIEQKLKRDPWSRVNKRG